MSCIHWQLAVHRKHFSSFSSNSEVSSFHQVLHNNILIYISKKYSHFFVIACFTRFVIVFSCGSLFCISVNSLRNYAIRILLFQTLCKYGHLLIILFVWTSIIELIFSRHKICHACFHMYFLICIRSLLLIGW